MKKTETSKVESKVKGEFVLLADYKKDWAMGHGPWVIGNQRL